MTREETMIDLAKRFEKCQEELKELGKQLTEALVQVGLNNFVQDPETMVVYKVVKPRGTFTEYRDIGYERTAFEGERAGSLSKVKAEEAGFVLKK